MILIEGELLVRAVNGVYDAHCMLHDLALSALPPSDPRQDARLDAEARAYWHETSRRVQIRLYFRDEKPLVLTVAPIGLLAHMVGGPPPAATVLPDGGMPGWMAV